MSALTLVHSAGAATFGDELTVYPVIADPPVLLGAIHDTVACAFPAVAVTLVGAPGTVRGVMEADADDAVDVPATFVAVTVNVYAVPLVKPVKVQVSALMLVQPVGGVTVGDEVTEYPVILDPPLEAGALHETLT